MAEGESAIGLWPPTKWRYTNNIKAYPALGGRQAEKVELTLSSHCHVIVTQGQGVLAVRNIYGENSLGKLEFSFCLWEINDFWLTGDAVFY